MVYVVITLHLVVTYGQWSHSQKMAILEQVIYDDVTLVIIN